MQSPLPRPPPGQVTPALHELMKAITQHEHKSCHPKRQSRHYLVIAAVIVAQPLLQVPLNLRMVHMKISTMNMSIMTRIKDHHRDETPNLMQDQHQVAMVPLQLHHQQHLMDLLPLLIVIEHDNPHHQQPRASNPHPPTTGYPKLNPLQPIMVYPVPNPFQLTMACQKPNPFPTTTECLKPHPLTMGYQKLNPFPMVMVGPIRNPPLTIMLVMMITLMKTITMALPITNTTIQPLLPPVMVYLKLTLNLIVMMIIMKKTMK